MSHNATDKLANLIEHAKYSDFTAEVIAAAKASLLDFIGVAIAGFSGTKLNRLLMDAMVRFDSNSECTILGKNKKVSAVHAALINATSGHSLDLDDGHRQALGHPGVCVVPAALALGESIGSSGKDILTAIIAGYETFIRMGKSMNPAIFSRGFHTTGVCGTVAAAAAAAKMLSFNRKKISDSLGIAAIQSAGLLAVVHSGQMMKPLNAGKASFNGVLSAILVQGGASGPQHILEDKDGFGQAFAGHWDPSMLLKDIGQLYSITECYRKLYPACRHSHAAIDATLFIRDTNKIAIEEIKKIQVTTYPAALKLTQKEEMPRDIPETRFNLAFAVSLALTKGAAGLAEFSMDSVNDPNIHGLFKKIQFASDPSFESKKDNIRGAEVEIILADNKSFRNKVLLPKGEPENPASIEELEEKFKSCIGAIWSAQIKEEVIRIIRDLEQLDNIQMLTTLLRPEKGKRRS
ncbi:MAG: MmgE/PrpD family protein [Desulfobacterales bacterium]|jgi:2-methylcitrate dehydratase PrpD